VTGKTIGLLHELVPRTVTIGFMADTRSADGIVDDTCDAVQALGLQLVPFKAGSEAEIERGASR
jgi:hypothetical protein